METTGKPTSSTDKDSHTLARTVDRASMGAHDVIDRVSDAARPAVDRVASSAHQTVSKIAGAAGQAAETLGAKGEQIKNVPVRAVEQCRGYVRDNPVAALSIAVAAGFLLSRLWRSR